MSSWKLLEAIGVELEYMIVHQESLDVLPVADKLIERATGSIEGQVEFDDIAWSNELVLHVIEIKTNGPVSSLNSLADRFSSHVGKVNTILAGLGGRLMPTAAHPWMNPAKETQLWPHECGPIYQAFNRIFGCSGHGWSNLQSTHLNLSFSGDEEFARLHSAIRLLMPIMPALTASSPIMDGAAGTHLDNRMKYYCTNSAKIPQVAGKIIPEGVYSETDYQKIIFSPMYQAIASHDPEGILAHEFLNARGAIARFDRGAIEIRVLDIQETPLADLACAQLIVSVIKALCESEGDELQQQMNWEVDPLAAIFQDVIKYGDQAVISDPEYLRLFGLGPEKIQAIELWQHLAAGCADKAQWDHDFLKPLQTIFEKGSLARRIERAVAGDYRHDHLKEVYSKLCDCLAKQQMFVA
ncbi:glutamate-cysteine ligase family protein [Desulforhopalus sp. IMCC35007]|uniref:carboxylate-amine ligase n=1 Tax=Desulforhopalus sp. IMCC35007 TaxID=2569543 RepID=UPI0010AE2C9C|nr:glutamate-cysteine ligase family protein [Desulforhopalus sp. IMCC35007]TKB09254.1 glutamate--cysteine ligase [Desulforhopalus sp. IMCC35007]